MVRTDLTDYDMKPAGMLNYLRYYGPHFNQALCDFAVRRMKLRDASGKMKKVSPWTKEEVNRMIVDSGLEIENNVLYDAVYLANMCKADYYGSSIEDEEHVARYVKDTLDDEDAVDGEVFECFLAKCARRGVVIDWTEMME